MGAALRFLLGVALFVAGFGIIGGSRDYRRLTLGTAVALAGIAICAAPWLYQHLT